MTAQAASKATPNQLLRMADGLIIHQSLYAAAKLGDFGRNIREPDATKVTDVNNLSVALLMFERSYNRVADLILDFTKLCEERLKKTASSGVH